MENEIHRINLQASEAIHIKRKYRSIKDNLISDSVRFENALKKLETAIKVQEKEIKRLQVSKFLNYKKMYCLIKIIL